MRELPSHRGIEVHGGTTQHRLQTPNFAPHDPTSKVAPNRIQASRPMPATEHAVKEAERLAEGLMQRLKPKRAVAEAGNCRGGSTRRARLVDR